MGTRITGMARQLYILKVMGQYKSRWETGWHSRPPMLTLQHKHWVCCRSSSVTGIRDTFYHHNFLRLHDHWTNKQNPHACMLLSLRIQCTGASSFIMLFPRLHWGLAESIIGGITQAWSHPSDRRWIKFRSPKTPLKPTGRGWRDGLRVKNTSYSWGGSKLTSQYWCQGAHEWLTPALGDLTPLALSETTIPMCTPKHRYTYTHTNITKNKSFKSSTHHKWKIVREENPMPCQIFSVKSIKLAVKN